MFLRDKNTGVIGFVNRYNQFVTNTGPTYSLCNNTEPVSIKEAVDLIPVGSIYNFNKGSSLTGTDPEFFIFDKDEKLVPAFKVLPDDKTGAVAYNDGFQAEIKAIASYCHSWLLDSIHNNLKQLMGVIGPDNKLVAKDVVKIEREVLLNNDIKYVQLGCMPSQNVYKVKPIHDIDGRDLNWRSAGTHLHFSYNKDQINPPRWFPEGNVVMLDKILGLLLTALGRDLEDPLRRTMYGRAGEYRLPKGIRTPYVEYRTPGAFVISHPMLFSFAADIGRMAWWMGLLVDGRELEIDNVPEIINNCDADAAYKKLTQNKNLFDNIFKQVYSAPRIVDTTWDILKTGVKQSPIFSFDMISNWRLKFDQHWQLHNENSDTNWRNIIC